MINEEDIIKGCLHNDRHCQRLFYDLHSGMLYSVALRYISDRNFAEDICAEAWIKIFKNIAKVKERKALKGWMCRIVSNEALMHLRKKKIIEDELSPIVENKTSFDVPVSDQLIANDILQLLSTLPIGCRTVFNLYEIEGYKHREIAETLNISINTSKSQLILAKKKLKQAYLNLLESDENSLKNNSL